jgi:hypothetical protein
MGFRSLSMNHTTPTCETKKKTAAARGQTTVKLNSQALCNRAGSPERK